MQVVKTGEEEGASSTAGAHTEAKDPFAAMDGASAVAPSGPSPFRSRLSDVRDVVANSASAMAHAPSGVGIRW